MLSFWLFPSIAYSISRASHSLVNQQMKLDGRLLTICRRFGLFLIAGILLFFIEIPKSPIFYLAVLSTVPMMIYQDVRQLDAIRKYGAGVVSRIMPLAILITFIVWGMVSPEWRHEFFARPLILQGVIIICLGVIIGTAIYQSKSRFDVRVMAYLWPVLFTSGIGSVLNKISMINASSLMGGVVVYMFIQSAGVGGHLLYKEFRDQQKNGRSERDNGFSKDYAKAGTLLIAIGFVSMTLKNIAMAFTPNPAYVSAITLLAPIWIILFNKINSVEDRAHIPAGITIVASVCILLLSVSL